MSDTIFDPEVHATGKDGSPTLNRDGSFRKKRRDAGAGKVRSTKAPSNATQHRRYEEGVQGLFQIPAMALSFVNPVDGFCVAHHTPSIAKAVADLAVERPEVASALDRVLAVGPYGALIGAVIPLAIQLMHNHDMVPESMAKSMGATPKKDIERHLKIAGEKYEPETESADEREEYRHGVAA